MGFASPVFGFNEPTLTTVAYVSYLLAFILFAVHILTRSRSQVVMAHSVMAFVGAGAAAGGTMDVPMGVPMGELQERRPSGLTSQLFGRVASSLVLLAWVSLTVALALRW